MQPDAHKRALIAGSIGNFIEWYEFAVYGFLATVIAKNFFQLEGEAGLTSLILTYASFAIAFFFRPLGAVVFGRIGDRIGRKPTLIIVLVLMTLATAAIGIVPVYASIGIAAPLIITLLRILQGLFAGGEYGGAVSLMTEFAPRGKRGLYGAWQSFTVALGLLAGAGIVALLSALLTPEALHDWGWRIPFFLALPMGAVALWLRVSMEETPSFVQQQDKPAVAQDPRRNDRQRKPNVRNHCDQQRLIKPGVQRRLQIGRHNDQVGVPRRRPDHHAANPHHDGPERGGNVRLSDGRFVLLLHKAGCLLHADAKPQR
ncbi:MFS transporter, partial [Enterobacter roggenkampii]|uniref:MFS transporter n=1 Tax=Enterobacter roggenkampii TaxID=1812935 RepID=UPI000A74FB7B